MQMFLEGVRRLVLPRFAYDLTLYDRVKNVRLIWEQKPATFWETFNTETASTGFEVCYYKAGEPVLHDAKVIRLLAWTNKDLCTPSHTGFVLIHELCHAARKLGGHDDEWAALCRRIGILECHWFYVGEMRLLGRDMDRFLDKELERDIEALPGFDR